MDPEADRLRSEVAYVLFLDMEGYSRLALEEQARVVRDLHDLVRTAQEFSRCEAAGDLLRVDTGDGMALIFFRDPQSPIRCACEIAEALGRPPRLPLRIGLHSGPVVRRQDINGRENVSGDGINLAQRVMDCGDAGHVLLSRSYADLLRLLPDWAADLHDLGEFPVKHGLRLPLVGFHRAGCGNPRLPMRLHASSPTNLPFWRADQFVGRAPTLALVHSLLQAGAPTALVGLSGLGKTLLALHYAHLHARDYPGGVFWINAADSGRLKEDYASLGRSFFDIPETLSTESCVVRLRDRLHHLLHPALFVFDNVTEDTDLALLPTSPQCRFLLTTQEKHLVPPGFETVMLPKLDPDAALALLHGPDTSLSDEERAAARLIADAVGRLPLALSLIAQHRARLGVGFADYQRRSLSPPTAAHPPEQKLLRVLERAREKFVAATSHKGNIYETIERVYLSLGPSARAVLAASACFAPAGFGRDLLGEVLGAEEDDWEEALADLADASLITEDDLPAEAGETVPEAASRLRLHELFRTFARMQLTTEQHHAYSARLAAVLTDRMQRANEGLDWRGIRAELPHLNDAVSECRLLGLEESLYPLLTVLGSYLALHRDFSAAERHVREGLLLVERLYPPVHESRARLLRLLAELEEGRYDSRNALRHARAAVQIARRVYAADPHQLPDYFATLGYVLKERRQFRRAQTFQQKALDRCTARWGEHHPTVALCRSNLAMIFFEQRNLTAAEDALRQALQTEQFLAADGGATAAMCVYWNNLGRVLGRGKRWPEAWECHRAALDNNRRIHGLSHTDVASSLYYCAVALRRLRQWAEARAYYQEALSLYRRLYGGDDWRCGVVRKKLAALAKYLAKYQADYGPDEV